jgi:hypothetical protein
LIVPAKELILDAALARAATPALVSAALWDAR